MQEIRTFSPSQSSFASDSVPVDLDLMSGVQKPSRYLGGEVGQVRKDLSAVRSVVGLCYPDLYEIGMSHIGLRILYSILNGIDDVAAERVYAVAPDMEQGLRSRGALLSTLENRVALKNLHVLGFTLQYELSYSNVLQVLDLGGIPLRSADRGIEHPLVIAGGPCAFNPEPLAPFVDAVCLGDGEETVVSVVEAEQRWRGTGRSREYLLRSLCDIPGVYVPSLYTPHYLDDGRIASVEAAPGLPERVLKAIVTDLDKAPYPTETPVPFMNVVHDRVGVEIQRGCMRGCRFCQAGYIYRPERQRSPETIQKLVRESLRKTGIEEYSLLSLSAGDYNCVEPLLTSLMDEHEKDRSAISLPSMRLETLSPEIMEQVGRVRKTSFTVAPEAGSDRLRSVVNKVIDEDVLVDMVDEVFRRGWRSLKLYFMLGLPTEQYADLEAIVDLGARCLSRARRSVRGAAINVSVSSFVPKSHTPFQWASQIGLEEIRNRQDFLARELRREKLGFRYHESRSSVMEGVFSRGDRRASDLLEAAYRAGARLDGWQEHLSHDAWAQGFEETGLSKEFYNQRHRAGDEVFPWDHIDIGVKREWLWEDWQDALEGGFVPDCSDDPCYDCGVCDHKVVHNRIYASPEPESPPEHRDRRRLQGSVDYRKQDPQFVAMPQPPGRKANNVVDAVPSQGLAPGSAIARAAHRNRPLEPLVQPRTPTPPSIDSDAPEDLCDTRLPPEQRIKVEIRYGKRDSLAYLGHLEVMQVFRRALRRLKAPVIWSRGFRPAARLSFGPALPAGMCSTSEFAELELKRPVDVREFCLALQAEMPENLPVFAVREVDIRGAAVAMRIGRWAYQVMPPSDQRDVAGAAAGQFLASESALVEVTRKGKTKVIDIRPVVTDLQEVADGAWQVEVEADGPGARIRDILRGVWGGMAAAGTGGWATTRTGATFHSEADC